MNYQQYKPPKWLSGIVQYYWTLEGTIPEQQMYIHRTLANFCPELIFHYGGTFDELTRDNQMQSTFLTGIHGQTDRIRRFTAKKSYGIFSVLLQPYAIPLLFGISSSEIKNELIDLVSLLGQDGKDITEKMMGAKNNAERLGFINRFLENRTREFKRPEIVNAVQHIYAKKGMVNVHSLASQASYSQRQFERNFKDETGFTPKTFSRIVRFKSLVNLYKKGSSTLTHVAYEFGYYDQAHFIQDFKQFSGYNPHAYFSGKADEVFYAP
ncbi:MAG TPA: helix-turn-helix domain-containing protein [Puia sp.]|jgi:AraC-like DNA-binding protein|nr:helix-turn-helix domain-containing protein [Puia sp.]